MYYNALVRFCDASVNLFDYVEGLGEQGARGPGQEPGKCKCRWKELWRVKASGLWSLGVGSYGQLLTGSVYLPRCDAFVTGP